MTVKITTKAELLGNTPPADQALTDENLAARVNAALKYAKDKDLPSAFVDLGSRDSSAPVVHRALELVRREYPDATFETGFLVMPILSKAILDGKKTR